MSVTPPKFVVVTGASSGIGRELAKQLAKKGFRVGLIARRKEQLEAAQQECGGPTSASFAVADVTNKDAFANALKEVAAAFDNQPIDVLVNNAGGVVNRGVKPSELSPANVESDMQTNFYSSLNGVQLVLPQMRQRKTGQIVQISSILGRISSIFPNISAYNGAKHFLNAYTEALREELASEGLSPKDKSGIVISTVSPGPINTDPEKPAPPNFPYPRQPVESCCEAIVKLILNRDEECYTDPAWYYKVVDTVGSFGKP